MESAKWRDIVFYEKESWSMKDLFSNQSNNYAHYRPSYPKELVNYLIGLESQKNTVWDCGAGSGQMTRLIAPIFKEVYATDISQNQLAKAPKIENVHYSNQRASQCEPKRA